MWTSLEAKRDNDLSSVHKLAKHKSNENKHHTARAVNDTP